MSGYTKLFARILDSTIWREPDPTRILWITMLALADRDGVVHCTAPGLADRARITLEQCRAALNTFLSPDQDSLTMEDGGRRIRRVEDGWVLINYEKYRRLMSDDDKREKTRIRVKRWREANSEQDDVTLFVTQSNAGNDIAEAKAEADTEAIKPYARPVLEQVIAYCHERKNSVDPQKWFDYYTSNGWKVGRNSMKDWKAAVRTWERNNGNGNAAHFASSKSEQRVNKNRSAIIDGLGLGEQPRRN